MKSLSVSLLFVFILAACSPEPRDIQYGLDLCHFCKMTIVDNRHAAQLVTQKGKCYMFDAIECAVNFKKENPNQNWSYELVSDYTHPGKLLDAHKATFLISQSIPSPMGAFLTAFSVKQDALDIKNKSGGEIHQWTNLKSF